jgi:tetrahydromethanopterin S-methyltransferase subunit D
MKNKSSSYVFPAWSAKNKTVIFLCALIGLLGGFGGAAMIHFKIIFAGIVTWHVGLFAVLVYGFYYIRATYQRYMDLAWDVYY